MTPSEKYLNKLGLKEPVTDNVNATNKKEENSVGTETPGKEKNNDKPWWDVL